MRSLFLTAVFAAIAPALFAGPPDLPENFYFTTLDNGLQVLTIEDPSVPLVTVDIAVHNGAFTESPEYDGLSHLYEHMFFKANAAIPSQEAFMKRVHELGIAFNGQTSEEKVEYFITLSSSKLQEGMKFMDNAIEHPLFLASEMKKEDPVVNGEFQRDESNPVFELRKDISQHMWGDLWSHKNTIGNHDVILSATPEKMHAIQNRYYYPNNSVLIIAGDVHHEDVDKLAKQIYSGWKPSPFDIWKKYPVPEFKALDKSQSFVTVNDNARVPILWVQFQGPDTRTGTKYTYAADAFSYILSQKSSKFQKDLVDSGLALQANISYQTQKYVGPINLIVVPNPSKLKECEAQIEKEIAQFDKDDYFTDEQLSTAKRMLAIQEKYSRESTSDLVHTVAFWWASASLDYYTHYIDNLKKVTRQDIKDYVHKYIQNQPNVTGLLLSPQMQKMMSVTNIEPVNTSAK